MARRDIAGLFSVNGSVMSLGGGSRPMRLPTMNQFPKLNHKVISQPAMIDRPVGKLPEMTTDVIDVAAGYAVKNVRRGRSEDRMSERPRLRQVIGMKLGSGQSPGRPRGGNSQRRWR